MEKLRFTGRLPTEAAMHQFPNWELALDEEGEADQDETTLRPSEEQSRIDSEAACTAAIGTTWDGRELMTILCGDMDGSLSSPPDGIDRIHIFANGRTHDVEFFTGAWRLVDGTPNPLRFFDPDVLPLRVVSVLPGDGRRARRHEVMLMGDGVLLVGDAARTASFSYPPWFLPSDVAAGDRGHLLGRWTSINYTITEGKRESVGRTERTVSRGNPGTLRVALAGEMGTLTLRTDTTIDEASLEAISATSTLNGTTRTYTRGGEGSSNLPANVFGDDEFLLRCVPLAEGWKVMIPALASVSGHVRNCLLTVEAREPAPDHPGSSAWRVLVESGNQLHQRLWIDAQSRRLLATRVTVPGTDIEHMEIFGGAE